MLVKANIPFNMMNCRMQDTSPEVPRVERNDCWNQPIPWASVPTFMFVIFRFSFACGTATITFNLLWCLPTYKVPPLSKLNYKQMCDSTRGLDALLQPHPGREREKESRNSVSGRSAHLRAFRPPWMVMAGEKSGVCEPRVFPKIVIILVHKSFSNLLKFWVPHFQANPFDPRAHVTHNGWSPFYTCLLGYLIRTHGILCSEHHRKKYNEPGLNTCLGWWGNDPATQKIIRAVAEVYQHYRSYTSQRILAFAYQDPPRKQQWCWYKNKFGLIPPKVNEWWFSS